MLALIPIFGIISNELTNLILNNFLATSYILVGIIIIIAKIIITQFSDKCLICELLFC